MQELSANETITYLYEPDSFVPMVRIASSEWLGHSTSASTSLLTQTPLGFEESAISSKVDVYSDANGLSVNEAEQLKHIDYRHVKQWMLSGHTNSSGRIGVEKVDGDANENCSGVRDRGLAGADFEATNDHIAYYNCDHLGTPRELIDETHRVIWSATTHAWGSIFTVAQSIDGTGNAMTQPLRFQGQYEDFENGLFYNRSRYYDGDSGKFLTADPVGLLAGLNAYAYAPNPTGWVDPLGLNKRDAVDLTKVDRDCDGRFRDHLGRFAADPGWPVDRGFLNGKTTPLTIPPGTVIDRYGYPGGTFVSPVGVPFEDRALPSSYKTTKPYYVYEVVHPIGAQTGTVAPWFKAKGLGVQHELSKTVQELLDDGSLREISRCPI